MSGSGFPERYGPWAVIAGGSDGIGAAFARELAARGISVALIGRNAQKLEAAASDIGEAFGVETRAIAADLTDASIVSRIAAATEDLDVGLFVHNAGSNPTPGRFLDRDPDEALFLVALSCRAPVALAHHFGTRLRARGRGGLILMSSLASLSGSAYQATYAATKAFDTIFAEGLWIELAPEGVDVLGVLAGATRTETVLAQSPEGFADAMDPREVARGALAHLGRGPNWVPGAENQAAARGLWPLPRVGVIHGMTQAGAQLFDLPALTAPGVEFDAGPEPDTD